MKVEAEAPESTGYLVEVFPECPEMEDTTDANNEWEIQGESSPESSPESMSDSSSSGADSATSGSDTADDEILG